MWDFFAADSRNLDKGVEVKKGKDCKIVMAENEVYYIFDENLKQLKLQ